MRSTTAMAGTCCILALLSGCGGSNFPTVPAKGKVMVDGRPMTEGRVMFAPIGTDVGPPAMGEIQSNGTFVLSTYKPGDGAVVGQHRVTLLPARTPSTGDDEHDDDDERATMVATTYDVEAGKDNDFTIEINRRRRQAP